MKHYLWIFLMVVVIIVSVLPNTFGAEKMKERAKIIRLPKPKLDGEISVEKTISKRRSVRSYANKGLSLEQISQLLWSAQGITDKWRGVRAAPSAGALYPLEIYLVNKDGLFHYVPKNHVLERVSSTDIRRKLYAAASGQSAITQAAVDIIICAVYKRVISRYGQRGIRYTDIEVGHVAENVHLQAVALGLASVPIGYFNDVTVSKLLSLPEDETPLYIIPVGYKR